MQRLKDAILRSMLGKVCAHAGLRARIVDKLCGHTDSRALIIDKLCTQADSHALIIDRLLHDQLHFRAEVISKLLITHSVELLGVLRERMKADPQSDLSMRCNSILLPLLTEMMLSGETAIKSLLIKNYQDKLLDAQLVAALKLLFAYIRENKLNAASDMLHAKIKLQLGAGGVAYSGWFNTDIHELDMTKDESWAALFLPGSISNILAEHVVEHLSLKEWQAALTHVHKYLAPGGVMRIAVPDAFHPSRYYYNLVKPGGEETPFEHKIFLDYTIVKAMIDLNLFDLKLIEYFDENGIFHAQEYDLDAGEIMRCSRKNRGLNLESEEINNKFYSSIPEHLRAQFFEKNITYTSLFFDIVKV